MFKIKYSTGGVENAEMYPGLKVSDVLESLASEGRKGYLRRESINARQFPSGLIIEGETYIFVEKRPKDEADWMKKQLKMPSASALAKSVTMIVKYLGGSDPVYDVGRVSGIMPLPVAHEAFGLYAELYRCHVPTTIDWTNVTKLLEMSEFFENEKLRRTLLHELLTNYLKVVCSDLDFVLKSSVDSGKRNAEAVDIQIIVKLRSPSGSVTEVTVVKVEVKNELGLGGEPCVEALKCYGDYVNETAWSEQLLDATLDYKQWTYYTSCVPMLIVELVGANIRVGGAICHDRPGYEPLTPYLHLLKNVQDLEHKSQLARAVAAIPRTVQALAEFYRALWAEEENAMMERVDSVAWPFYLRKERERDPGLEVVKFSRKLDRTTLRQMFRGRDEQLLYLLKYTGGDQKVVKFCQRYGADVHKEWAKAGFAPEFTVTELNGGWKVIEMQVYSPEDGWMPVNRLDPTKADNMTDGSALDLVSWNRCKKAVLAAYDEVHRLYPTYVHGDLRKGNILYNQDNDRVIFVDFDWAGVENEVRYPPFLNPHIAWPKGVESGSFMLCLHDAELLRLDLET